MTAHAFTLCSTPLRALPSGALHILGEAALCVSDLHLGKSDRIARRGGGLLPPYEARETLTRLEADILATRARQVICLGDSFDDLAAQSSLGQDERLWLARLQAGRRWVWIEGNHDPGPVELGGSHLAELALGGLIFRHIAVEGAAGEVSGHYHPKHRIRGTARPAFLYDKSRLILPAYGTYTGGLSSGEPALSALFKKPAMAVLTGTKAIPVPF
jgi:DNA ligase-associated metallophosphoesterase